MDSAVAKCVVCDCTVGETVGSQPLLKFSRDAELAMVCVGCGAWIAQLFVSRAFADSVTVGSWPEKDWHEAVKGGFELAEEMMGVYRRKPRKSEQAATVEVRSVAVIRTTVKIEGKGEGLIQEYPGGKVWASIVKPIFRKLGSFGSKHEAERAVMEALA